MKYTKSGNDMVNKYIEDLPPSVQNLFIGVRELILNSKVSLSESIKWKDCLVYTSKRNIIQTVTGKDKVSLIFFDGINIKDTYGILEGEGKKTRTMRIKSLDFNGEALQDYVKQAIKIAEGD